MTAWMRKALVAVLLVLAPLSAMAEGKGGGETFVKLPSIVLEFWDASGIFHAVNMDLSVAFPVQTSMNKAVSDKIALALSAMSWEEFSQNNPATTIKAIALDVVRKEPGGDKATDVLINKLLLR